MQSRLILHSLAIALLLPAEALRQPCCMAIDEKKPEPEAVKTSVAKDSKFAFDVKADRLIMTYDTKPLGEYVWGDPKILRPYFANLHGPTGTKITRNHPPIKGKDATDHDTMHPGIGK